MSEQVYFAAASGRIKIGTSREVQTRVADIATNQPTDLELIGHIDGGRDLEQLIHRKLKAYRLKGEWFRDCDETRRFIRNLILNGPSAIGYEPRQRYARSTHSAVSDKRTPEQYGASIAGIANLMWPNDALRGLATFSERPEHEVKEWFAGTSRPPRLVQLAFANLLYQFITVRGDEPKSKLLIASLDPSQDLGFWDRPAKAA